MAFIIAFSLYLFAAPVAMAAPADTVSQNTTQDVKTTVSQNTTQDVKATVSQNTTQGVKTTVSQNTIEDVKADDSQEAEPDTVSTADEFTAWLEEHKNGGGNVKLTNNIVLKEFYYFTPNGANLPDIIVDTDIYRIIVAGNICFFSDGHLVFRGKANSEGIFHVNKGGVLTLDGVVVEGTAQGASPQYTLWQEEGAGLLIGNTYSECIVSGEIHYADMPLVTESASVCVIVEKGQSADGLFPVQVRCNVNYQGQVRYNELVPVSWNLTGTEEFQEKRQRFQVEGFSSQAAFEVAPVCTVVYNDYPLTFTNVDAFMRDKVYYFQGDYTKPQGMFPLIVIAEYSFDGKSWIEHEESTVTNDKEPFCIYFLRNQWDQEQNPYIYIRLRGKKDDKIYLSNVLRYKADSMNVAEDLGGSRGGGTSIVDPPDEPKDDDSNGTSSGNQKPSGSQKPSDDHKPSQDSRPQGTESENYRDKSNAPEASDTDVSPVSDSNDADQNIAQTITQNAEDADVSLNSNLPGSADNDNLSTTVIPENRNVETRTSIDGNNDSGTGEADEETVPKGTVEIMSKELAAATAEGNGEDVGKRQQKMINQRLNITKNVALVLGFVTVSAGVGVAGYFVHTSSLRRHKRKKKVTPKNSRQKGKSNKTRAER